MRQFTIIAIQVSTNEVRTEVREADSANQAIEYMAIASNFNEDLLIIGAVAGAHFFTPAREVRNTAALASNL